MKPDNLPNSGSRWAAKTSDVRRVKNNSIYRGEITLVKLIYFGPLIVAP